MIFAFVVIVGILVVPVLNIYLKKLHTKKKLKHVPSLQNELPIIGHGHWFLFKNTKRKLELNLIISTRDIRSVGATCAAHALF